DAAGIDHVAAVAGHAEVVIHLASKIGVVCPRAGGESHANRQRPEDKRSPRALRARRASHAQTFFCRTAATSMSRVQGLSAHDTLLRATCGSMRLRLPPTVALRARASASRNCPGLSTTSPSTPKPLAIAAMFMSGLPR